MSKVDIQIILVSVDSGKILVYEPQGVKGVKNVPKIAKRKLFAPRYLIIHPLDFSETLPKHENVWYTHDLCIPDPEKILVCVPKRVLRGRNAPILPKMTLFAPQILVHPLDFSEILKKHEQS